MISGESKKLHKVTANVNGDVLVDLSVELFVGEKLITIESNNLELDTYVECLDQNNEWEKDYGGVWYDGTLPYNYRKVNFNFSKSTNQMREEELYRMKIIGRS